MDPGVAAHNRAVESSQQKAKAFADSPAGAESRLEELVGSYVIEMYEMKGLAKPTTSALKSISEKICTDIRNGGDGQYFHGTYGPTGSNSAGVASSLNYAYATVVACDLTSSFQEGNNTRERMLQVLVAYVGADSSNATGTVSKDVDCMDGSSSKAGGSQGACSWHGGIAD